MGEAGRPEVSLTLVSGALDTNAWSPSTDSALRGVSDAFFLSKRNLQSFSRCPLNIRHCAGDGGMEVRIKRIRLSLWTRKLKYILCTLWEANKEVNRSQMRKG